MCVYIELYYIISFKIAYKKDKTNKKRKTDSLTAHEGESSN